MFISYFHAIKTKGHQALALQNSLHEWILHSSFHMHVKRWTITFWEIRVKCRLLPSVGGLAQHGRISLHYALFANYLN